MKTVLPLCVLFALTGLAQAQERPPLQDKPAVPAQKKVEEKPVPDINKSPWSVDSRTESDGMRGTSTTTLKRDIGDGLSIGGQMQRQYQEPSVGGKGPPGPLDAGRSGTIFGPVLEKKF
jgi:hypothetical protein